MGSGWCDFCQMWHSGGCCHPNRPVTIRSNSSNPDIHTLIVLLDERDKQQLNRIEEMLIKLTGEKID